jgi:hypothetical protein
MTTTNTGASFGRGVESVIRRETAHDSGLCAERWVVERSFALLPGFPRLRTRYERLAELHLASSRSRPHGRLPAHAPPALRATPQARWQARKTPEARQFHRVRPTTRAAVAAVYLGLAAALAVGMDATVVERDFGDV